MAVGPYYEVPQVETVEPATTSASTATNAAVSSPNRTPPTTPTSGSSLSSVSRRRRPPTASSSPIPRKSRVRSPSPSSFPAVPLAVNLLRRSYSGATTSTPPTGDFSLGSNDTPVHNVTPTKRRGGSARTMRMSSGCASGCRSDSATTPPLKHILYSSSNNNSGNNRRKQSRKEEKTVLLSPHRSQNFGSTFAGTIRYLPSSLEVKGRGDGEGNDDDSDSFFQGSDFDSFDFTPIHNSSSDDDTATSSSAATPTSVLFGDSNVPSLQWDDSETSEPELEDEVEKEELREEEPPTPPTKDSSKDEKAQESSRQHDRRQHQQERKQKKQDESHREWVVEAAGTESYDTSLIQGNSFPSILQPSLGKEDVENDDELAAKSIQPKKKLLLPSTSSLSSQSSSAVLPALPEDEVITSPSWPTDDEEEEDFEEEENYRAGSEKENRVVSPLPSATPSATSVLLSTRVNVDKREIIAPNAEQKSLPPVSSTLSSSSSSTTSSRPPSRAVQALETELEARLKVIVALKNALLHQRKSLLSAHSKYELYRNRLGRQTEQLRDMQRQFAHEMTQLKSERDALEAEVLWSREELTTMRNELSAMRQGAMEAAAAIMTNSSEGGEDEEEGGGGDDEESSRQSSYRSESVMSGRPPRKDSVSLTPNMTNKKSAAAQLENWVPTASSRSSCDFSVESSLQYSASHQSLAVSNNENIDLSLLDSTILAAAADDMDMEALADAAEEVLRPYIFGHKKILDTSLMDATMYHDVGEEDEEVDEEYEDNEETISVKIRRNTEDYVDDVSSTREGEI